MLIKHKITSKQTAE